MLVALCLCSTAAAAQAPVHVTYSGYTHGFNVVDLDATLSLTPGHYKMELNYTLVGVLGTVLHGDGKTVVTGRFEGLHAAPDDLFSTGHFRGEPRATQIAWHGGNPSIVQLTPPVESERDPVPPALQANTIDTLSAMAGLIHQVAETGKCEEHGRTFDGRRLSEVTAHTVGAGGVGADGPLGVPGGDAALRFPGQATGRVQAGRRPGRAAEAADGVRVVRHPQAGRAAAAGADHVHHAGAWGHYDVSDGGALTGSLDKFL